MNWEAWVLIGFFIFGAIMIVANIGKERPTITPGSAVVALTLVAFEVWLVTRA